MKKNKLITLITCAAFMLSAVTSSAAGITAQITNGVKGEVTVSGTSPAAKADSRVNILVLPADTTPEKAQLSPKDSVQYQNSVITEEGGAFTKTFTLNLPDDGSDELNLNVYVGGEGFSEDDMAVIPLYYASIELKIEKADAVCKASAGSVDELVEASKDIFGIDTEIYNSLDKEALAEFFANELENNEIAFEALTDANLEANTAIYGKFEELLRYSIAMEAYNQNKQSLVLSNGKLEFDEILGISAYIEANGTLNEIYTQGITSSAKAEVPKALFGIAAETKEDLHKAIAKQIILKGLTDNVTSGSGIVDDVLTDDNIAAADLNLPKYTALSSTENADDTIYSGRANLTIDNMESKIESAAETKSAATTTKDRGTTSGKTGSLSVGGSVTTPAAEQDVFNDLAGYDWAKTAIEYLAGRSIISGMGDGSFDPAGVLTREAAAKIICLAFGISTDGEQGIFADVAEGSWYAPYVYSLYESGVVKGISDTEFGVGRTITREDFAVMIYRALNWTAESTESVFADKADISSYASDAVNTLCAKGIINGYEDDTFRPRNNISRAEGAKIIYSVLMAQ